MNTKETKRVVENRFTCYDLIVNEMKTDEMKTAVDKTLGILYTEQSAMPLSEEKIPLHVGIYFYCYAEEDEIGGTPCKDEVIVIRQSFWQENGVLGDDTTMKMSLFSAKMQMGMDSYEEIKTYFLEHFSHKMAFYKLMRFFIRNDIDFGCDDEELVEELEEDIKGSSGPDSAILEDPEE